MKLGRFLLIQLSLFVLLSGATWVPLVNNFETLGALLCILGLAIAAVASIIVYIVVLRGISVRPRLFFSYVIVGMLIKMGTGILSIVLVGFLSNPNLKPFAVSFLIGYAVFTSTEVYFLMKTAQKKS